MPHASMRSSASSALIVGRGNSRASSVLGFVRTTARTVSLRAIGVDLLEDLLARGAEPHGALHVGDEPRALAVPEREQRDRHELRVLPRRELPLRIDVAARR